MDYKNGKIYVIRNYINDKVYIGSTTQSLSKRFSLHKSDLHKRKYKIYNIMNELKFENFYIELVELFECKTREELTAREGHFIRLYDSVNNGYNTVLAGRTKKEWNKDNNEKIKEQKTIYRETHREKMNEESSKYYFDNKEKIKEQNMIYKLVNKEKIKASKGVKFECECGGQYTLTNKAAHFKTSRHSNYFN